MNNFEKDSDNLLRKYMSQEMIEKAPSGFSSKVMARVHIEGAPEKAKRMLVNKSLVPLISVIVTIVLVIAALLSSGSTNDSMAFPLDGLLRNFEITLPEINFTSVFRFDVPVTIVYVFIGILILTIFDRALHGIFHKER